MKKLCLVALGCPKNIVESESIAGLIQAKGIGLTTSVEDADYALVHTCSFIADARGESVGAIKQFSRLKKLGKIEKLFVTGCFVQSEGKAVLKQFPEVDACIGTGGLERITEFFEGSEGYIRTRPGGFLESSYPRLLSSPLPSAYLRLSEGCNHRCSFCVIPRLRGKYVSRAKESILAEAGALARAGIQEINLVAQDTSCYGIDIYGRMALPGLLKELARTKLLRWIRLMYAYPSTVTGELMDVVASEEKLCKYIDMPLQHVSDRVLKSMRRPAGVKKLVERLHSKIPGVALRTAFITGFPGETEKDFSRLADFVAEGWFEHMGVFEYSPTPGTVAAQSARQVPDAVKRDRKRQLMIIQQGVVAKRNKGRIGSVHEVIVENANGGMLSGRAAFQAPEIDSRVLFRGSARPGSFVKVEITGRKGYDLTGRQRGGDK